MGDVVGDVGGDCRPGYVEEKVEKIEKMKMMTVMMMMKG